MCQGTASDPHLSWITESAFIGDVETAQLTLHQLQSIGIEWSVDEFATEYSSLNHCINCGWTR